MKENLIFFEASAKNNDNVKTMFYSAIASLPFFEQFGESNKLTILGELGMIMIK